MCRRHQRGTVAALAHPVILAHLKKLSVSAVELMPIVAWVDERHLPPLGLRNAWGYNPVAMMALDPACVRAAWPSCAIPSPRCMRRGSG
jgi:glycogen operon protein